MRNLPLSRQQIVVGAIVLALVLALGSRLLRRGAGAAPPPPLITAQVTATTATALVVDVVGAVRHPGLLRLPQDSRVADALARAGGATPRAQLELVNLAAPVADGEQIVVPRRGSASAGGAGAGPSAAASTGPLHLNTATLEQLDGLPGVGPVTAQKILDYRQAHGAFSSVDELDAIPGIGPARLGQLRELVAP